MNSERKKECLDSYTNKFKCSSSTTMEYRRNECSAKQFKWDRTRFVGFFFNSKFSILLSHVLFIPIYFVCAFLFLSLFFLHFHSCNGHFVWLEKLLNTKQITTMHCCIYTQSHTQTHAQIQAQCVCTLSLGQKIKYHPENNEFEYTSSKFSACTHRAKKKKKKIIHAVSVV